jgi:GxxExxY protein
MHEGHEGLPERLEAIGKAIVDSALKIHRAFGPGLLEGAYEAFLAHELEQRGHKVDRQLALPAVFEGVRVDIGYRIDLVVDNHVVIEVKSVDQLLPVHDAQLLTYLRLSSRRLGYLINFNVNLLKHGLRRKVL